MVSEKEVSSLAVTPTRLLERCNYLQTGYSPFGIAFRRQEADSALPFSTWAYKPPYLRDRLQIDIAQNTKPNEPLIFVVPFNKRTDGKPVNHPVGTKQVTSVQITIPASEPFSESIDYLNCQGLVKFVRGQNNLVSLEYDRSSQKQEQNLVPDLPLKLRW